MIKSLHMSTNGVPCKMRVLLLWMICTCSRTESQIRKCFLLETLLCMNWPITGSEIWSPWNGGTTYGSMRASQNTSAISVSKKSRKKSPPSTTSQQCCHFISARGGATMKTNWLLHIQSQHKCWTLMWPSRYLMGLLTRRERRLWSSWCTWLGKRTFRKRLESILISTSSRTQSWMICWIVLRSIFRQLSSGNKCGSRRQVAICCLVNGKKAQTKSRSSRPLSDNNTKP